MLVNILQSQYTYLGTFKTIQRAGTIYYNLRKLNAKCIKENEKLIKKRLEKKVQVPRGHLIQFESSEHCNALSQFIAPGSDKVKLVL